MSMPASLRCAAPLVALFLSAGAARAQPAERFTLRDDRVAIYNVAGQVRVEAGTGSDVTVEVTRGGSDGARLGVERGRVGDASTLRVVYPEDRIVYPRLGGRSNTQFTMRNDGGFGGGLGGRRISVSGSGRGMEAYADLAIRVPRGQTISIHHGVGEVAVSNVDGRVEVKTASASVGTRSTRGAIDVDVGSGSVRVDEAEGNVKVDTGSGSVRLAGVRGDRLDVDTGSGSVSAAGVRVATLAVDVGSGGVRLTGVRAERVGVDSGSGSVSVELLADAEHVEIDTGSGGVTLAVPANFGASVEIDTGSGGIAVDVPVRGSRSRRSHFTGSIGDGQGRVTIDTGSGGVRIRGS